MVKFCKHNDELDKRETDMNTWNMNTDFTLVQTSRCKHRYMPLVLVVSYIKLVLHKDV